MDSKTFSDFRPAPWCFNGHSHTILCSLLFSSATTGAERVIIDTPDGDFLEIDIVNSGGKRPVVILFHGLEGGSHRYYITRLTTHLSARGFNTIAVNFRSCGSRLNQTRRFYHSGEISDPETVIQWAGEQFPESPLFCAGFSLGASVLLNFLKAHGNRHPLRAAAAISTPFDLKQGSLNLERGFNRFYSIRFLRTLKRKLDEKRKTFPDLPKFSGSTLYDFDDMATAPIHGFEGAAHYYESCSAAFFMDQIKTDTLLVHSRQDPICPFEWIPAEVIRKNSLLTPCFPSSGGHVGFWSLPPGWLEKTITDYFTRMI